MNVKKTGLMLCLCLIAWMGLSAQNTRVKYTFNSDWRLHIGEVENAQAMRFNDQTWKAVTLPAAFNEDEAFRVSIIEHTDTIVWYRKNFRLPKTAKGQKVFLEFEGIRFGGEFWVNGKPVGLHENGVMAFGFDVTDLINYAGDNVIAARIDNSWRYKERATGSNYQWNNSNFYANFGGIPRNVYLHVTPRLYQTLPLYSNLQTTGTYIYAREINVSKRSAVVFAETEVRNELAEAKEVTLDVVIEDLDGKVIKTFSGKPTRLAAGETNILKANARVNDLHFWSWGYGYLYTVSTVVSTKAEGKQAAIIDVVKTRTGFRKTRFANGLFWLNDRVLQIKGYAERSTNEWPSVGQSVPAWLSDYSNKLMVESNGNTVRWMHVTPWKQDIESCDRVGLMQLVPAGDAEGDVVGRRWEHRVMLMRDAIIYNRNNPSVVFWEGGNEKISEEHMADLKAVRDQYDPYGGRAIGSREMLDSQIAEWGGEMLYINKSAKHPLFATEYCRDEGLRWYWDDASYPYHKDGEGSKYYRSTVTNTVQTNVDARPYNRNQDSFFKELVTRWWDYYRVRPGTGTRVSSGGLNIQFHEVNSHWRGEQNYRRSGVVDALRVPKEAFYAHQVMWNGWVDIEKHGTYICGHWNYENARGGVQQAGEPFAKEVMVVSTGDRVELFLNGKSLGFGERSVGFLFTFPKVTWKAGTLMAISYDEQGKELSRHQKETAGTPDRLTLKLMTAPDGFKADGSDMALVEIEVVDKQGRRCPLDNSMITFDLQGPAEWRGGIAHGGKEGNYILEKSLPVESGVNRVLIRSIRKAGNVRLTATARLANQTVPTKASLEFNALPIASKNGLSTYIPAEHLPVNLDRGATPNTPSFTLKRTSVAIVNATAGSNEKNVRNSFDDNELSEWSNDGRLVTGWITYELERDAVINEVELKLTGWRMRSYPLQIYVDDVKVFEGETDKSLGYVALPVTPTKGRFVTIKLIGQSTDNDAFGGIVEVEAAQAGELDLFKDPNATNQKGQLRIVEAEFYEAITR
ncbi:MAG TPA: beta-galactosidase [Bacteroidales bacterium]|nr:beta-galactosidase [Bacteroidales bacterium]